MEQTLSTDAVSSPQISIREACKDEWTTVADVTQASYAEYGATADPEFWRMYEANTRQTLLNDPDIVRLVLTEDGTIIASAIYCPPYEKKLGGATIKNPFPEMRLLSVLSAHRNKKLGDLLIQECEKRARESGAQAITLHTTKLMTVAKAMYERRGYARFDEIDFEPVNGFIVWGYIKRF